MTLEHFDNTNEGVPTDDKPEAPVEDSQKQQPKSCTSEPEDFRGKPNNPNSTRWF